MENFVSMTAAGLDPGLTSGAVHIAVVGVDMSSYLNISWPPKKLPDLGSQLRWEFPEFRKI
jgi:hypothetical protein